MPRINRLLLKKLCQSLLAGWLVICVFLHPEQTQAEAGWELSGVWGFIPNRGQFDPAAQYLLYSGTNQVWLTQEAIWIVDQPRSGESTRATALRLSFSGANPGARLEPFHPSAARLSFLQGTSPENWQTGVPLWGGVRYVDLYPGVDLVLSVTQKQGAVFSLDWYLEAHPGADLDQVRLRVEGANQAQLVGTGLLLETRLGVWVLPLLPVVGVRPDSLNPPSVQQTGQQTFEISSPLAGMGSVSAQSPQQQSMPGLIYGTYLGGSDWEIAYGIAIDEYGAAYVVGRTPSLDFPVTPGALDSTVAQVDLFVAKLNPAGDRLEYATFIGGSGTDSGYAIAVQDGVAYVVGETDSPDFPQASPALGETDAFLLALNPDGSSLRYVTRLGGSLADSGYAVALDGNVAHVTGMTNSYDFPAPGYLAEGDAFLVRVGGTGKVLGAWLFGGANTDAGMGVAAWNGVSYLTGETYSPDFPGTGYAGEGDSFFLMVNAAGSIEQTRLFGGNAIDRGSGIGLTSGGEVYLAGTTASNNFPAPQGGYGGGMDGFVLRLAMDGKVLGGRFVGGQGAEEITALGVDAQGRVYLTGQTNSPNFPISPDAFQRALRGRWDAFLVRLDPSSQAPAGEIGYATLFGGSGDDFARSLALDRAGNPFLTGYTTSPDFPLSPQTLDTKLDGSRDAFVVGLGLYPPPPLLPTPTEIPTLTVTQSLMPTASMQASPTRTSTSLAQPSATQAILDSLITTRAILLNSTSTAEAVAQPEETQLPAEGTLTPPGSTAGTGLGANQVLADQFTASPIIEQEPPPISGGTPQVSYPAPQPQTQTMGSNRYLGVGLLVILLVGLLIAVWWWFRHKRNPQA